MALEGDLHQKLFKGWQVLLKLMNINGVFFILLANEIWCLKEFGVNAWCVEACNNTEEIVCMYVCMQIAALWFFKYMMITEDICDVFSHYRTTTFEQ